MTSAITTSTYTSIAGVRESGCATASCPPTSRHPIRKGPSSGRKRNGCEAAQRPASPSGPTAAGAWTLVISQGRRRVACPSIRTAHGDATTVEVDHGTHTHFYAYVSAHRYVLYRFQNGALVPGTHRPTLPVIGTTCTPALDVAEDRLRARVGARHRQGRESPQGRRLPRIWWSLEELARRERAQDPGPDERCRDPVLGARPARSERQVKRPAVRNPGRAAASCAPRPGSA